MGEPGNALKGSVGGCKRPAAPTCRLGEHCIEGTQGGDAPEQFETSEKILEFRLSQGTQPNRVVAPKRCRVGSRSAKSPDVGELLEHFDRRGRSNRTLSDQFQELRAGTSQRVVRPNRIDEDRRVQQDHRARLTLIASRSRRSTSGDGTSINGACSTASRAARRSAVLPG